MVRLMAISFLATLFATIAQADYPSLDNLSEQQPPTMADWMELRMREQSRRSPCDCAATPLSTASAIVYLPESGCSRHGYGVLHPGPYYIQSQPAYVAGPDKVDGAPRIRRVRHIPTPAVGQSVP